MKKCLWLFALVACGSNGGGDDNVSPDAKSPDATPVFMEAAHGPAPTLINVGGPVLTAPKTQRIFFTGDTAMQTQIESFDSMLSGSSYWMTNTAEYGVGNITSWPTIVVSGAVPTSTAMVEALLKSKLDGTHTAEGWQAAPDPQTIYSVFLPEGTVIHDPDGDSCSSYAAFHDQIVVNSTTNIVYAMLPRCNYGNPLVDDLTSSYSHELLEAATDPLVETTPAWGDADANNYVMAFSPGAEVGDYCEYLDQANIRPFGGFEVQRTWSNAASLAGKDPCIPSEDPYIAGVPQFTGTLPVADYYGGNVQALGVSVPVGMSTTIPIQLISNVATPVPFTVNAVDSAVFFGGSAELQLTLDKTTGVNGDIVNLTVKRLRAGQLPGSEFFIEAKIDDLQVSQWWGYVAN